MPELCTLCFQELTPEELDDPTLVYRQVMSWVTGPKQDSPVLREKTGNIAHKTCIHKLVNGQSPDQQSIPGLEM